jgi:integrase/recombinase XerC
MIAPFLKYLQFEKRVSPHTLLAYETDLKQFESFLQETFPDDTVAQADYGLVRAWIISLVEAGTKPTSVNRKIASLRSLYKFMLREQALEKDPMLKIKPLKTGKRLPTFVKENDMAKVLDTTDFGNDLKGRREQLILELFYATGIRLSELIHLKESYVDLHSRTIKVLGKRNKERVIPFAAALVNIIKGYTETRNREVEMKGHGYLFVTDAGEPCYPGMVYQIVRKHLQFSNAEKRSPHVLRHTFATHLLDKGAEINAVKDLLGHTSLAATQVYTHNSLDKLKKAFEQAHPKA